MCTNILDEDQGSAIVKENHSKYGDDSYLAYIKCNDHQVVDNIIRVVMNENNAYIDSYMEDYNDNPIAHIQCNWKLVHFTLYTAKVLC